MKLEVATFQILDNFDRIMIVLLYRINVLSTLIPKILTFITNIYIYIYIYVIYIYVCIYMYIS